MMRACWRQPMALHHGLIVVFEQPGLATVMGECVVTGELLEVNVLAEEFDDWWLHGELIQKAMPNAPPAVREFLQSAVGPHGWQALFGQPDKERYEHAV